MSLTADTFDLAEHEAILAGVPPRDLMEALRALDRIRQSHLALVRHQAWGAGRKGDGVSKIEGFSDTLTGLLRRFGAWGVVTHAEFGDELHRHVSALRKLLKKRAPDVVISTLQGEGYEIVAGFDSVYRLLHAGQTPSTRAPGLTAKQTQIVRILFYRGSIHTDQFVALQRHMSNVRKRLPKGIVIRTHPGEGLYTLEGGKEILARLLDGSSELTRSAA